MPRYYFNVLDDTSASPDEVGLDFPDLEAAKRECEQSARELLMEDLEARRPVDNRRVEISDAKGTVLHTCYLRDFIN
jgi:hypothetical protein